MLLHGRNHLCSCAVRMLVANALWALRQLAGGLRALWESRTRCKMLLRDT